MTAPLQAVDPVTERGDDFSHVAEQPRLTVEQAMHLPALLSVRELAPLWGVSVSQAHLLNRKCAFDVFKVHPAIGPRQFSGVLLGRYLCGEPLVIPSFGARRRRS